MASAAAEVDEDFFDRLVDDDDDILVSGSGVGVGVSDVVDEVEALSQLSVSDVSPVRVDSGGDFNGEDESGENSVVLRSSVSDVSHVTGGDVSGEGSKDGDNGVVLASLKDKEDPVAIEESNAGGGNGGGEFGLVGVGEEQVLDGGVVDEGNIGSGSGLKEVQWSSLESKFSVNGVGELRSDLDFFDGFGDGSVDPFVNLDDTNKLRVESGSKSGGFENVVSEFGSIDHGKNQHVQNLGESLENNVDLQDLNRSQSWEDSYPGWRFEPITGQWYQLDGYVADSSANQNTNAVESVAVDANSGSTLEPKTDLYNWQQTAQAESVMRSTVEEAPDTHVTNWNLASAGTANYPPHMVFDPQYPGWYYDTIAQEWRSLESYTPAVDESTTLDSNQQSMCKIIENNELANEGGQNHGTNWDGSVINYNDGNKNMWPVQHVNISDTTSSPEYNHGLTGSAEQQIGYETSGSVASNSAASWAVNDIGISGSQTYIAASQSFSWDNNQSKMEASPKNVLNPPYVNSQRPATFSPQQDHNINQFLYSPSGSRSSAGRPSHALVTFGFGGKLVVLKNNSLFGTNSTGGIKDSSGGMVNVLSLREVLMENTYASNSGAAICEYFHALCHQSFPGPLVSGNVGNKELNKWIDEMVVYRGSSNSDYINWEAMSLLFSMLKIACQYYGKLRSPFGTDPALQESDSPESAVAKLLGNAKKHDFQLSYFGGQTSCLQNLPSEVQIQATAFEVQKLLVSGRKMEALQCAQKGQLWGLALVLASQLGDQFYGDTVKQMALQQLVAGSPLRTLCLLIAGQPADIFSNDAPNAFISGSVGAFQQPTQIGANFMLDNWEENLAIIAANRTKGDELVCVHLGDCLWKERWEVTAAHVCYLVAESDLEPYSDNARLCLIGADHLRFPRTYASPQAIQRTELFEYAKVLGNPQYLLLPFQPYKIIYAHMLAEVGKVAESLKYCQAIMKSLKTGRTPEVDTWKQIILSLEERLRTHQQGGFSNLARNNLLGKVKTFFDSTASRVVGSVPPPVPSYSHSNFLPNESAVSPPVSSYQHGNFLPSESTELPPVPSYPHGNFLPSESAVLPPVTSYPHGNFLPSEPAVFPPAPSYRHGNFLPSESANRPGGLQVSRSQSTTVMTPLMPQASMEHISERIAETNQLNGPNKSASEPDFGKKVNSSDKSSVSDKQEKASASGGSSRLGRFGSSLLRNTVGLVLKSRTHKQAKLGENNKFYYDEKLKRWVEEGADPPAEEPALAPPPTFSTFQNGTPDNNVHATPKTESFMTTSSGPDKQSPITSDQSPGMPPIPPSSNQFSARGKMGIRSRYVDTFNKGGAPPAQLFHSPAVSSSKPANGPNPKFFVPGPVSPDAETVNTMVESTPAAADLNEELTSIDSSASPPTFPDASASPPTFPDASASPPTFPDSSAFPSTFPDSSASPPPMTMHRYPSVDNIIHKKAGLTTSIPSDSRRVASWSGSLKDAGSPMQEGPNKPLGGTPVLSPSLSSDTTHHSPFL